MERKTILVTGCAGFIGFHTAKSLLDKGYFVVGVDNLNKYYEPKLKLARLKILKTNNSFRFYKKDICNYKGLDKIFTDCKPEVVCHLAAQAGVRYSVENPMMYEHSNSLGFLTILELLRKHKIKKIVFASSSSIYGGIKNVPYVETMNVNKPESLYAATKAANELYAYSYYQLYGINAVGLRFFTVYGPWGRPDMAVFLFTEAIINNKPIKVFNYGKMKRDFTYIDDVVSGIVRAIEKVGKLKFEIINLGNSSPVELNRFIEVIEGNLGKKAEKELLPKQPGDMLETFADIRKANKLLDYSPTTTIETGVKNFVEWYRENYKK